MRSSQLLRILFSMALLLACSAWAQTHVGRDSASFRIQLQRGHMVLEVMKPASLGEVLEAFCGKSEIRCDIIPSQIPADLLAPMIIEGAVSEVLYKLLDGTKLNYTWLPGSLNEPSQLTVSMASQQQSAPSPAVANSEERQTVQVAETPAITETPSSESSHLQLGEVSAASEIANTIRAAPTAVPDGMQATPFFGRDGSPILTSTTNPPDINTPFIDSRGNPIPMPAKGPAEAFTPFFDKNGNPIPMPVNSNQSEDLLPFIDKNGQLIPSTAVRPR